MEYQLRRYGIAEGSMDEFVEAWRRGVVPLRERLGFVIEAAWLLEQSNEFVWVIGHDGLDGLAAADQAYYDSPERAAMDPDPKQFIEEINQTSATKII